MWCTHTIVADVTLFWLFMLSLGVDGALAIWVIFVASTALHDLDNLEESERSNRMRTQLVFAVLFCLVRGNLPCCCDLPDAIMMLS